MRVVLINKQDVGVLQTWFVQALSDSEFVFILAGRKWQTVEVDLEEGIIIVKAAGGGQISKWMGGTVSPRFPHGHHIRFAQWRLRGYIHNRHLPPDMDSTFPKSRPVH